MYKKYIKGRDNLSMNSNFNLKDKCLHVLRVCAPKNSLVKCVLKKLIDVLKSYSEPNSKNFVSMSVKEKFLLF